jgi:hypothetical protein
MEPATAATAFPEAAYPPAPADRAEYEALCALGRERAGRARAVVCGLARDLGDRLPAAIAAADAIGGLFADHRVVVFENDSADATAAGLAAWAARDPRVLVKAQTIGARRWGPVRDPVRGDNMAYYRNHCHDEVGARYADFDYVLVMDTDLAGYSLDGVRNTLGRDGWDAMGAQGLAAHRGRAIQYDVWAWRDPGHPGPHAAPEINPRVYGRGRPPVPVLSCFGGLMAYRTPAFLAARYAGGDCEHARFHLAMAAAGFGRIFMNPAMVTCYA